MNDLDDVLSPGPRCGPLSAVLLGGLVGVPPYDLAATVVREAVCGSRPARRW
jgi:hypothetical protein